MVDILFIGHLQYRHRDLGLTVSDKQTNAMLHKHPLHRISFCADDKQDKKGISFN